MAHVSTADRSVQFIEAAVRVIAQHGVAKATTRRIAEAADAPLAALHYCFRDKDSLFQAVVEHLTDLSEQSFTTATGTDELRAVAEHYLRFSIAWTMENPEYALAQLDLHLWMARNRPAQAVELADGYVRSVAERLRSAAVEPVSADAAFELASVLTGALDGLVAQWAAHRDDARAAAYTETLCATLPSLCDYILADTSTTDAIQRG